MLEKKSLEAPRRVATGHGSDDSPPRVDFTAIHDTNELVRATNDAVSPIRHSHWAPNTHQILIIGTLSIISFMVALDACIIVTSLTVSISCAHWRKSH